MTGAKLNKIYTEFVFFKASPDESTVGVVYSFPAGTMGDGAECPGGIPCGAKLDKTQPKFPILEFSPDKSRKSPCLKIYPPQKLAVGAETGRYGDGIIITPEYKPAAGACRSRGAPGARRNTHPIHFPAVGGTSVKSPPSLREGKSGCCRMGWIRTQPPAEPRRWPRC